MDEPIVAAVAKAIDCDPAFVTVRRTVTDHDGAPREKVEVVVSSWAVLLHDDPATVVTKALNEVLSGASRPDHPPR